MDAINLSVFKSELEKELSSILSWWIENAVDNEKGGFYGKIDNDHVVVEGAAKGLVLNARILYTFSSAYALSKNKAYLATANRAYDYLITYFNDELYGGFYWSVDDYGNILDSKKQVYGQAFAIYALAEYYKITKNPNALKLAQQTFYLLEEYSFDKTHTGYLEAFTAAWLSIEDLRLSEKDQNEKKTMNTHLHVIEAYANLYVVWPNEDLKKAIKMLLSNFKNHLIDKNTHHLHLFLTETWEVKSDLTSFGHDIEAAWLLQEAAEIIDDVNEITDFKAIALRMSKAAAEGITTEGGLFYEYDIQNNHLIKEYHWWPQAEAMVGFFNAWQINGNDNFLKYSVNSWSFIKKHLKDYKNGEWFWGVEEDLSPMQNQDKAGFWKCPYHNGRACIELIKRIR